MRICPKCGAFYASDSSAFCLADGTPLVSVDPTSENWSEGTRAIEEQTKTLQKHKRRLRWRRTLVTTVTITIITMVVSMVAINGWYYLKPDAGPFPTPTPSPSPPPPASPTVLPSPSPTPSPSPSPPASPTVLPSPSPTPSPSPSPPASPTVLPSPSPTPIPDCSSKDVKDRETNIITKKYGDKWLQIIDAGRTALVHDFGPAARAAKLGPLEFVSEFSKDCSSGSVTLTYAWRTDSPAGFVNARERRTVQCSKTQNTWTCGQLTPALRLLSK